MERALLTDDGLTLAARRRPGSSGTAVVVTHGFASHQDHDDVVALAEALHADGHTVVTYDGRGHGRSEGLCTLGDREALDVAAAAAWAREDADRVVLVGASMGAIAVLRHAAANDPSLAGVVAVSSPASWEMPRTARAMLATVFTRTRAGRWFIRRRLGVDVDPRWSNPEPPLSLVAKVRAPVAFVHGRLDRFIRPSCAVELHAAVPEAGSRRLDLVEGMDHAYHSACVPAVRSAVEWALGQRALPAL